MSAKMCVLLTVFLVAFGALAVAPSPARAIPLYARQTGLQCGACHTAYPELNEFGREFKLNGYTLSTGQSKYPPFAVMMQPSFTHTGKDQASAPAPRFGKNNNAAVQQTSLFLGGKLLNKIGAFIQLTYDGVARELSIDNTDIRYADTGTLAGKSTVFGVTLNNNPTVQDLWNSTPAWGFPFASSSLAPSPAASTLIDGGLEQQVLGLGAYARWNRQIYAELTGYKTLPYGVLQGLGVPASDVDVIDGVAPYWRLAFEKNMGSHYFSFGTFGLAANTFPGRDRSAGSDHRLDLGLDAEYQYFGQKGQLSLLGRYIHEDAQWDASQPLGNASNSSDSLNTFSLTANYLYDKTYGISGNAALTTGGADATLYGSRNGKPDTQSFTVQLSYLPFNKNGGPSFWPWFNPKFVAQYTAYTKFNGASTNYDGTGRNASDNNTFYLAAWLPM